MFKKNCKQTVKLRSGSIKSTNYCKQLVVPFKIYDDFECNVKKVKSSNRGDKCDRGDNFLYTEDHIPWSFAYKVACVDDKFSKPIVLYRGKDLVYKFIKTILEKYGYCKKIIKKQFNKNLLMSAENEERFQLSSKYRKCDKVFDVADDKVRDHFHIQENIEFLLIGVVIYLHNDYQLVPEKLEISYDALSDYCKRNCR